MVPSSLLPALDAKANDHAFHCISIQTDLVSPLVAADREEHGDRIVTSPTPVVPSNESFALEIAATSLTDGTNAAHDGTPLTFTTHVSADEPIHPGTGTFLVVPAGAARRCLSPCRSASTWQSPRAR